MVKAIICTEFGAPDALRAGGGLGLQTMPRPVLGARQIRIAVAASGVNFADTIMIAGHYQVQAKPPFVPGLEAAGTVIEIGRDVTALTVGDRVLGLTSLGAFADEIVDDESRFMRLHDHFDLKTAAAFSISHGTAHMALAHRARVLAGETLLVLGAAGGAGLAAVEIGKKLGATVIAAAGRADKLALAQAKGADYVINYTTEDLRRRVLDLTAGQGADVVFDPVGGLAFTAALRSVAFEGRIVVVGFASGTVPQIPANHVLVKNVDVIGLYWGGYKVHDMGRLRQSLATVIDWIVAGDVCPHIGHEFPLADAAVALDLMIARQAVGKIILTV